MYKIPIYCSFCRQEIMSYFVSKVEARVTGKNLNMLLCDPCGEEAIESLLSTASRIALEGRRSPVEPRSIQEVGNPMDDVS